MRTSRSPTRAALALLILIVACATVPGRDEQVTARAEVLRATLTDVVSDPDQRGALLRSIDTMESTIHDGLAAADRLHREFADASADPEADTTALRMIADRIAANRRASLHEMMSARIALRRGMAPEQWRALAAKLPDFDGDLR